MSLLSLLRNRVEFKYDSQLDSDTIRLVRFRRPQKLGLLSLELSTHSLSDAKETLGYHALSYTWGPPEGDDDCTTSDSKYIFVNDKIFLVGRSLYDALIRLQEFDFAKYHWIDAICIDQTNNIEKGVQVSIMNHVYTAATRVNIWVGKSTKNSPQVVKLICQLARLHQIHCIELSVQNVNIEKVDRQMKDSGLPARTSLDWTPVFTFFRRNWFKRSWIIQEVAMAEWAVLIWGEHTLKWELIRDSTNMMQQLMLYPEPVEPKNTLTRNDHKMPILYGPTMISQVRKLFNDDDGFERLLLPYIQVLTGIDVWTRSASPMLAFLLIQCPKSKAKDQRDKVYSLLGMANRAAIYRGAPESTIRVDYGSSTTAVFEAATKTIIEECDHLGLISVARVVAHDGSEDLELTPDLPSWVPDFSTSASVMEALPMLAGHTVKWDASRYRELGSLGFRILGPQLHVKGIRIGTLSVGSTPIDHLRLYGFEPIAALLLRCGQRYRPTGEFSVDAFWRTLIGRAAPNSSSDEYDMLANRGGPDLPHSFKAWLSQCIFNVIMESNPSALSRVPADQRENYEALIRRDGNVKGRLLSSLAWLDDRLHKLNNPTFPDGTTDHRAIIRAKAEIEKNKRVSSDYENLICSWVSGRRFFVTDEGHMGMGVNSVTEGDSVWVLSSCPVPLVLRARADNSYQLIGDSYVRGAMHGEAVGGGEWEDICIT